MSLSIAIENVALRRGDDLVVESVTLRVDPGERVALVGPSGAGKSSLLRTLLGLAAPDSGNIYLGGRCVAQAGRNLVPPHRRGLAIVFQELALWPHLTVEGNLRFVLRARGTIGKEAESRCAQVLERVGLSAVAGRYPGELAGGEQQRVAIARAIVTRPGVVLLDEPLSNLDVQLKHELLAWFAEVFDPLGTTVILVTHDPLEAVALCPRLAILERGRIQFDGTAQNLTKAPPTAFAEHVVSVIDSSEPWG